MSSQPGSLRPIRSAAVLRFFLKSLLKTSFVALALLPTFAFGVEEILGNKAYPNGPEVSMTPGSLCDSPDTYRYPEKVAYCRRDVERELKKDLIRRYDEVFGYAIQTMPRQEFKIDHLIPLCAGGSNKADNLWPQHETVYAITDPLEPLLCQRMAEGKLLQAEAVRLIREAKADLSKVSAVLQHLNSL